MTRDLYPRASIGALLALFLVLVLPACWYGALGRMQGGLAATGSSSSNNNEEREEHQEREVMARDAKGSRPPDSTPVRVRTQIVRVATREPLLRVGSVAPPPNPAILSVRRLL
jgi:hypothetical protein